MKQIVVLSGKGGTGKTFVTSSLAAIISNAVYADCDVDAANLHLMLSPVIRRTEPFVGGVIASVDTARCTGCGLCVDHCRFDAISMEGQTAVVDAVACEGCGVCKLVCPADAVALAEEEAGAWFCSQTEVGPMVHATLNPGAENSGKLVEQVRRTAVEEAERTGAEWLVIDGPPGTGCAAKSAITGTDFALLVTEPTASGAHDLERIVRLAEFFGIPMGLLVNKSSLDEERTGELHDFAQKREIPLLGDIEFDRSVAEAITRLRLYPRDHENAVTETLRLCWTQLCERLQSHPHD